MNKLKIALLGMMMTTAVAHAIVLDWDKILFWTGSGPNKAALVVQFADNGPKEAYVWGFRWDDSQYPDGAPTGEDMARDIAANSPDLLLFTQYTGSMGSTVCGFGYYDPDGFPMSESISYDFDGASTDKRVSFNYFTPNETMHQTSAPGYETPGLCGDAIAASAESHIIEHPLNFRNYGYPAYDYDWWQSSSDFATNGQRWNAGWYDGYWSYWTGGTDFDELGYSGVGMSSRRLSDGQVDAWKFTPLDGPVTYSLRAGKQNLKATDADGISGASEQWHELNYRHFEDVGLIDAISCEDDGRTAVYDISGTLLASAENRRSLGFIISRLSPGVYITVSGKTVNKILIK